MRGDNELEDLVTLLALIILLLALLAAAYVIASLIAFVVAVYRYHKYRREAAKTYQEIADEVGASFIPDDVLQALFGVGVRLAESGWNTPIDWLESAWQEGTLVGEEMFDR